MKNLCPNSLQQALSAYQCDQVQPPAANADLRDSGYLFGWDAVVVILACISLVNFKISRNLNPCYTEYVSKCYELPMLC